MSLFLKIVSGEILAKKEINRLDLVDVRERIAVLVDVATETFYNAQLNRWVKIPQI